MNPSVDTAQRLCVIVGRALLGLYFLLPGLEKVFRFDAMAAYMAEHSVPFIPVLLVITTILQVGGGLSLIAGFRVPLVAFVLAGLTLVISLYMHDFWNFDEGMVRDHETQNFFKNLGIMAGLLCLAGLKLPRAAPVAS